MGLKFLGLFYLANGANSLDNKGESGTKDGAQDYAYGGRAEDAEHYADYGEHPDNSGGLDRATCKPAHQHERAVAGKIDTGHKPKDQEGDKPYSSTDLGSNLQRLFSFIFHDTSSLK